MGYGVRPFGPHRRRMWGFWAGAMSLFAGGAVLAGEIAPSQVTPDSLAPPPMTHAAAPVLPSPAPMAAPAGAQTLRFRLARLVVVDGYEEFAAPTAALTKPLEGRTVSVADLFALAGAVEAIYASHGYALVRVTVPAQRLVDGGEARLSVIDGFVERLELDGVPERARAAVSARVGPLVGRRRLQLSELERAVLLAGDISGLRLRSALARGQTPGGTVLALEGEHQLVSVSVGADNLLPATLGGWEWNRRLAVTSALGFGEQAYVSLASGFAMADYGFPMAPLSTIGGGVALPIGGDGWTLNPEFTRSITRLAPEPGVAASIGYLDRATLRTSYPLVRSRDTTFTLTGALESIDQQLYAPLFGVDTSHDAYGALRLGANWQGAAFAYAPFQLNGQISHGLGGRNPGLGDVPLSRQDAGPTFTKLEGDIHLDVPLPLLSKLAFIGRGQWSFRRPQLVSEQYALDGADALSAFVQGTLSVDAGETLRAEWSRPVAASVDFGAASVTPYLFAAQGVGRVYAPTLVEQSLVRATSIGLGFRFAIDRPDGSGATVGAEASRGFSNAQGEPVVSRGVLTLAVHN